MKIENGAKESAPVEHGIEGCNFINTHGGHLKEVRDIIHHADACPSLVLPLAEVKQGNNCCFLILRWVFGNNFLRAFHVLRGEFERNLGFGSQLEISLKLESTGDKPWGYYR